MPTHIFISYSRDDSRWVDSDSLGLIPYLRKGLKKSQAELWFDHALRELPGALYEKEIQERIEQADMAILLISRSFFDSPFILAKELPWIKARWEEGRLHIIPIVVGHRGKHVPPEFKWLEGLQYVPAEAENKPLVSYWKDDDERDRIKVAILDAVQNQIHQLTASKDTPPEARSDQKQDSLRSTEPPPAPSPSPAPFQGAHWGFDMSDDSQCTKELDGLLRKAPRIILIGIGLNILHKDPILVSVFDRAARGDSSLEIYLARPESPAIQSRLIEEELGDIEPGVGREGLKKRLRMLLQMWRDRGRPDTIKLRVFDHYPTMAVLIIGSDFFFYPYGYARLGNFSPMFHFSDKDENDRGVTEFLKDHYRRVRDASLDLETALEPAKARELFPFAVYFVPEESSALYPWGSEILGYDVRRRSRRETPYAPQLASAPRFGFHLTICDAVYFLHPAQIAAVTAEIKFLATEFRPFTLTDLRPEWPFPGPNLLSLSAQDPSGSLEALHHELIFRVQRRASASHYTLKQAQPDRDADHHRASLMIQRYLAPYVLSRYRPHFTLLDALRGPEGESARLRIAGDFAARAIPSSILVDHLDLMTRTEPDGPWSIKEEIRL